MINNYLTQAFKSLNILDEDVYDFNEKDIDIVDDKINNNDDETIDVIDAEANDVSELKDSYVGKVIIDCNVCHSKIYKDKEKIVVCDENDCVNVDEECPYCASTEGFVIVGEIAPFNGDAETNEGVCNESLEEVAPNIRSNILSFPNGTYFYIDYENGKLFSGSAVGGSIVPEVSIDYDKDETFDANLNNLFDKMIEENPELLDDETLDEASDPNGRKLFKEFKVYVDGRLYETSHTEQRRDEIVKILKQTYPESDVTVEPYNHYESGYARKSLERIIAKQLADYGVDESLDEAHRESADEDEVRELTLYAENDSDTYHRMTMPTIKNLARKMKAGKFDKDLAVKAFLYVAEYAAKKYKKEFDGDDGVFYKFNPATREEVAKNLLDGSMEHIEGIANGEYNEALDVSDRVIIDTKEDGFLTKKHDLMKDGYKVIGTGDGKIIMAKPKKMDEAIENISIDTGDQVIDIATETKNEKEEETVETIKPVSDDTKEEIKNNNDIDIDVDEFDEETFDELSEEYLKKNYSNVESYKTSCVKSNGNTLRLEGVITFKSGNKKATNFVFESACITKDGIAKFNGKNEEIAKGKKSYTMVGSLKDNKFIAESLHYNYRAKDVNGEKKRIFGTSKKR